MAALDNTIKAEDIAAAQDLELLANFKHEFDRLTELISISGVETQGAGTTLYQYKVTGTPSVESAEEGDEVPLSKYTVTKEIVDSLTVKKYRKLTTAEAVLKGGIENAVNRTDRKLLSDIRAGIIKDYFTFLGKGTGTATGKDLQATLAQMSAKLADTLEKNNDSATGLVWFLNPYDVADYLADATVSVQNVFGMTYLESFLGVSNVFVTNQVTKGTAYVTPIDNIHIYGVDFGALGTAGLSYESLSDGVIGVHHDPAYDRVSTQTHVLVGVQMLAEIKDFIVKGTITPLV